MDYHFDEIIERKGTQCAKWDHEKVIKDPSLVSMWVADMDFQVQEDIQKALLKKVQHGIFGYPMVDYAYLKAVCDWMEARHGWNVKPEWIVPTSGIVPSIKGLVNTFTDVADEILVFKPVYYPFDMAVEENGRKLVELEMDLTDEGYAVDFEKLEALLQSHQIRMLILCSPHNPVGKVWSADELEKLGELANTYDFLVISDEIHMDLIHPGFMHTPFLKACPNLEERTVVCTAPSKTFNLAGLSTSNLIIPDANLKNRFKKYMSRSGMSSPNSLGLAACQAAYENGAKWVDALNAYVKDNFDFLDTWLREKHPQIKLIPAQGLYLAWVDFRALNLSPEELEKAMLEKARLFLDEGYIFGQGGAGFERLNLACPKATLEKALEQLDSMLSEYGI